MRPAFPLLVLGLTPLAAPAQVDDRAVGSSVSYVFASELGSGVYDLDGRTLQVYRIPLSRELRARTSERPGIRLIAPITLGFFDFEPRDIISSGLPSRVDMVTATPGIELEYALRDVWRLIPYARAGASVASSGVDGFLYGVGVRAERRRALRAWETFARHELAIAGVEFRSTARDDVFARLRNAMEFRRGMGVHLRDRELTFALYGIVDVIADPPRAPVVGTELETLQLEPGFVFGTRPEWRVRRVPVPRLGLGYRFAGELSGWRLVIGAPF